MNRKTILSKDFILVIIGRIVSAFGNQILRYALPLYLLIQTGSSALFGSIMAVSFIPMLLLFPVGGIIADRMNKRNIMLVLDFCTAILIALFCLLSGKIDIVPLMTITIIILYGIDGVDRPTVKASVPALVEPEHIMKANSIVDMIDSAASMAGPVIGGLLFSVFGLTPILYVSIFCFFVSVVLDAFIHIPFDKQAPTGNIFKTGTDDMKESFSFMLRERPVLWKVSLIFASSNLLLTTLITIGLPVIITQHLGFDPDTANRLYGYAQGGAAAGAILGGLLAGVLSNRLKSKACPILLIGCSLFILIGGVALQALSAGMSVYLVLTIGCGLLLTLHTLFQIQIVSSLQLLTPINLIGKVISCFMCVAMCTNPLGQFIYGLVFENIGSNVYFPFYVAGVIMIVISLLTRRIFYQIDLQIKEQIRKRVADSD
ncbi:MFS transporter [Clostridium sp. Marseille-P2415]|uniref:MFS transporter n=1 Tax=Clostridium sp. Marseille-P2415 TaxID=1805471 RepID=UPI00098856CD|nr:MFS transporter [Clostridium sp. Marseille-P2415]